ncbi:MAG: sulfatase [Marinilabiliales bacterium]|nr:sulfatase [Marinilabiliales bacterium]
MPRKSSLAKHMLDIPALLLVMGWHAAAATHPKQPNILFIVADDLGWSDLKCYGADLHETPNLDRLAAKSLRFVNSYAAAPVSSPTRASLMTGKFPARLHFTIWSEAASSAERKNQEIYPYLPPQTLENLPLEEITLAEQLKKGGYLTAHVGKWHLGDLMHFPQTQGFDVSVAASQRGAPPTYFFPYKGEAFGEYRFVTDLGTSSDGKYFADRKGEYLTDRLTDEAMKIMADAGDRPFFLNLWYYNVHTPLEAKQQDIDHFKSRLSPAYHHQHEVYAAMVKAVDDNVGRLLQKLADLGIADHTLVIFLSDNGGYINEYKGRAVTDNYPLRSGKGALYEGGIRVPTLLYDPDWVKKGVTVETPICTIDFYPTLLERTGLPSDTPVDGKSLVHLIKGEKDTLLENRTLYWHYPHYYPTTTPVSALREGPWKLLEFLEDGRTELYDLNDDPGEQHDLSKTRPELTTRLLAKLHKWKKDIGSQGITVNPNYKKP